MDSFSRGPVTTFKSNRNKKQKKREKRQEQREKRKETRDKRQETRDKRKEKRETNRKHGANEIPSTRKRDEREAPSTVGYLPG